MAVKRNVNKNVTNDVTNNWRAALQDAQKELDKAERLVASWKATIQTCRKRIAENAPWPGQVSNQKQDQQHSV
jgi:hypothetical protein